MSVRPSTPSWVQTVTVTAVSVVAAVAAVASYAHVHQLAERAGEEWRSILTPLSVDGMLVAAGMVMLVRRRAGQRAGWLPWTGLTLGIAASIAANVAGRHPEWDSPVLFGVVAAWPAVALAISFELLILVLRDRPGATVADVVDDDKKPRQSQGGTTGRSADSVAAPEPRSGREIPPTVPTGPHPIPTPPKRKPLSAAEKARRAEKAKQKRAAARQVAA